MPSAAAQWGFSDLDTSGPGMRSEVRGCPSQPGPSRIAAVMEPGLHALHDPSPFVDNCRLTDRRLTDRHAKAAWPTMVEEPRTQVF